MTEAVYHSHMSTPANFPGFDGTHFDRARLPLEPKPFERHFSAVELSRLRGTIEVGEGGVTVTGTAQRLPRGHAKIHCIITGLLGLSQSESKATALQAVRIERFFVLVPTEADLPDLEDEADNEDFIVVEHRVALSDLIEDELLLSSDDLDLYVQH